MKNKKMVIILLSVLFLIIVASLLIFASANNGALFSTNNQTADSETETDTGSIEDVLNQNNEDLLELADTRKTVIFAIYGTDERSDETGRSDIIMVVMYDPTQQKMIMASLPRDLRVNVPGYGLDKINHAYAYGGRELSNQTIEELLGIKLDFSVKLDFDTFASIINDAGGVKVTAQKDFYKNENQLVISQGEQVLNGKNALFYVRFRSDSDGDYGRIARQQEVVKSLMKSLSTMSLKKKLQLIETYYNNGVETDVNVSKLKEYLNMSGGDTNLSFENYRLNTYSQIIDGLWYELYSQEDLEAIKNLFKVNEEINQENWK
ncbi:LCP family protein [Acetobacterium wieringae]|uniref:LCP family protein n=1 Tax=Acetobacterium wieringae TaxID=52694 RepID=UPI002B2156DC|nr:LCP family protein [Acetobacterium wieringae]MEA4806464.1 LCP family protein [Acetobacterium wieringae]